MLCVCWDRELRQRAQGTPAGLTEDFGGKDVCYGLSTIELEQENRGSTV